VEWNVIVSLSNVNAPSPSVCIFHRAVTSLLLSHAESILRRMSARGPCYYNTQRGKKNNKDDQIDA